MPFTKNPVVYILPLFKELAIVTSFQTGNAVIFQMEKLISRMLWFPRPDGTERYTNAHAGVI